MGPWHEPMIEVAVREHVMNDSALPQLETMQMKYHVTRCVEAIYGTVSKRIRLKPLYKSTACVLKSQSRVTHNHGLSSLVSSATLSGHNIS